LTASADFFTLRHDMTCGAGARGVTGVCAVDLPRPRPRLHLSSLTAAKSMTR